MAGLQLILTPRKIQISDSKKYIVVGLGIVVRRANDSWQVLISRRSENVVLGGYWEFPGGKVEPNEDLKDCVIRELQEELAIRTAVGRSLDPVEHTYDHARVSLRGFYTTIIQGQPRNVGVIGHKWVDAQELNIIKFPQGNNQLTQQVIHDLNNTSTMTELHLPLADGVATTLEVD